ncbi:MAG: hypothetical protein AAF845_03825 [Bacteroidota bacterium]
MSRLLLIALAATLAACEPSASGLDPDDAVEAADTALADQDTDRALDLLAEAADAGHLGAMRRLADAYERGHIQAPRQRGTRASHLAVTASPEQAALARSRYADTLAARTEAGDPEALLAAALDLTGTLTRTDSTWAAEMTPAERDSLAGLHSRLDAMDVDRMPLGSVAVALGDTAAARRHLDEAVAAAEPNACLYGIMFSRDPPDLVTACGLAAHYDALAACPEEGLVEETAEGHLRSVRTGVPDAVALADSLRSLGVFDRHPRLGALFAEAES